MYSLHWVHQTPGQYRHFRLHLFTESKLKAGLWIIRHIHNSFHTPKKPDVHFSHSFSLDKAVLHNRMRKRGLFPFFFARHKLALAKPSRLCCERNAYARAEKQGLSSRLALRSLLEKRPRIPRLALRRRQAVSGLQHDCSAMELDCFWCVYWLHSDSSCRNTPKHMAFPSELSLSLLLFFFPVGIPNVFVIFVFGHLFVWVEPAGRPQPLPSVSKKANPWARETNKQRRDERRWMKRWSEGKAWAGVSRPQTGSVWRGEIEHGRGDGTAEWSKRRTDTGIKSLFIKWESDEYVACSADWSKI